MAPSSQSEDGLDLEQVTLQDSPLPPPIQRVMDPGQYRYAVVLEEDDIRHISLLGMSLCSYSYQQVSLLFQVSLTLMWQ